MKNRLFSCISRLWPLLFAQLFVALGNGAEYVAGTWSSASSAHGTFHVMIFMFCFWIPTMTFGPLLGVFVDRVRRKVAYLTGTTIGIVITGTFAWLFGIIQSVWLWPALLIGMGTLFCLRMPSNAAVLQEMNTKEQMLIASMLSNIIFEIGTMAGNAIGGWLTALTSVSMVMTWVCGAFVVASLLACFLPMQDCPKQEAKEQQQSLFSQWHDSVKHLKMNAVGRRYALIQMLLITCFMTSPVLLAPFVKHTLSMGARGFSIIEAAMSASFIISSFFLSALKERIGVQNTLLSLLALMAFGTMGMIFTHTFSFSIVFCCCIGIAFSAWSLSNSLLLTNTPAYLQGRIQSFINTATGVVMLLFYACILAQQYWLPNSSLYTEFLFAVLAMLLILVTTKTQPTTTETA